METDGAWSKALEHEAGLVTGLASTSSTKYDAFKRWFEGQVGIEPAVCYLSDVGRQWTARVGQALMGLPTCLVLFVEGEPDDSMNARLARLQGYVSGLRTTVVLAGTQGRWSVAFVIGAPGETVFDRLRGRPAVSTAAEPTHEGASRATQVSRRPRSATTIARYFELEPEEQAALAWEYLIGYGSLPTTAAIRIVAAGLRDRGLIDYVRLRADGPVYAEIELAMAYASRRGMLFDRPRRGEFRAFKADPDEYTPEDWCRCVRGVVAQGCWAEEDVIVRTAAEYAIEWFGLDMVRLRGGGRVDTGIRTAIRAMVARGEIERDERNQFRALVSAESAADAARDEPEAAVGDGVGVGTPDSSAPEPRPTAGELRNLVAHLPPECEAAFGRHLAAPFMSVEALRERVRAHLASFEAAFAREEFLDVGGARYLSREAEALLQAWPQLTVSQRALAQAAILYFTESTEADDDFAINGLRTDKAVMAAVREALG
jgi:hypothetical protein